MKATFSKIGKSISVFVFMFLVLFNVNLINDNNGWSVQLVKSVFALPEGDEGGSGGGSGNGTQSGWQMICTVTIPCTPTQIYEYNFETKTVSITIIPRNQIKRYYACQPAGVDKLGPCTLGASTYYTDPCQ